MKLRSSLALVCALAALTIGFSPPLAAQSKSGPFTINSSSSPCATITVTGNSTVGIQVTGTFSATLQPEVSVQGQTAQNTTVTPSTSATPQATITAAGAYTAAVGGYDTFLVCVSSYASGTATIYLNATPAVNASLLGGGGGGGSENPTVASLIEANTPLTNIQLIPNAGQTEAGFSVAQGNVFRINDSTVAQEDQCTFGPLLSIGGTGYAVNDTGTINGGDNTAAYQVLSVDSNGAVLTYSITAAGGSYVVANLYSTTPTSGSGDGSFEIDVTSVSTGAIATSRISQNGGTLCRGDYGTFLSLDGTDAVFLGAVLSNNSNGGSIHIQADGQVADGTTPFIDLSAGPTNYSLQTSVGWWSQTVMSSPHHALSSICQANGSAANPSLVACGANAGGSFSCATTASTHTCVISSSAVCNVTGSQCISGTGAGGPTAMTNTSIIFVEQVADEGTALGVTCNTNAVSYMITARSAGSFTLTLGTFSVNPVCFNFEVS